MKRLLNPLVILGLVGSVVVCIAVAAVISVGRGTPVELPVAISDIPPGTPLDPQQFRIQEVRGLDGRTLDGYVTAEEFNRYLGYPTLEMVHAGFPVGKAQVLVEEALRYQSRVTLLLSDPMHVVYPLPVTGGEAGNYVVAGDFVDVIFTLGRAAAHELVHVEAVEGEPAPGVPLPTPTPAPQPGELVTTTLHLPLAKVILPDVLVLRVEREQVESASATYGMAGEEEPRQRTVEGEVVRLYLELDREQAEVLSFALHNGPLNLPARAEPAGGASEGYTWDDFVETFFADRDGAEVEE